MDAQVRLRPYRVEDAARMDEQGQQPGSFEFYEWEPSDTWQRRFSSGRMLGEDRGSLVVEAEGVGQVGDVGWNLVHHGPPPHGAALNLGIGLFAEHRGKGFGTQAQRLLADYLFAYTRYERLEATTDVANTAEQHALINAGFAREGILRHAHWRAGQFHDVVIFSRLRGE